MLTVLPPEEVLPLLRRTFPARPEASRIPLAAALGRVLVRSVTAGEFVPGFDRSTVDGYAVRAADTFGCSDSLPAVLPLAGEIRMGEEAPAPLPAGAGMASPTGGALPEGADAAVMVEYTESFGDGTIGISKSAAPGENVIYKGDDVAPGDIVLPAGRVLNAPDLGALAALGLTFVEVARRPKVGILSTGDELVEVSETPGPGQVRDVNSELLRALCTEAGAAPVCYGILPDDEEKLSAALDKAISECDVVLLSGGSSVGVRDLAVRLLSARGKLLFHGIAMKPGKPTLCANCFGTPVFGLPGHPAAAFFTARLFVCPLLAHLLGRKTDQQPVRAVLTENVSANHGRAQYQAVSLREENGVLLARPIHAKSGLITALAGADGWFCIPRDCEGLRESSPIDVFPIPTV